MTPTIAPVRGRRVAVAGDWHGNIRWLQHALPGIRRADPTVHTILHVGDFGLWPRDDFLTSVDYWARQGGINRILALPGNHDDWDQLGPSFIDGHPQQVSDIVTFLPRGHIFDLGSHRAMAFGGAASHDRADRTRWLAAKRNRRPVWWAQELATEPEVARAEAAGPVDILLTHDTAQTCTAPVDAEITRRRDEERHELAEALRPLRDNEAITRRQAEYEAEVAYVQSSTAQIERVRAAARPRLHFHGHTHVWADETIAAPHGPVRTVSLGMDFTPGNVVLLDTATLAVERLDAAALRWPR